MTREITLPCQIGDEVWGIRAYKGAKHAQCGRVSEMFFTEDMRLMIAIKHICRGEWGKNIFATRQEAIATLEAKHGN